MQHHRTDWHVTCVLNNHINSWARLDHDEADQKEQQECWYRNQPPSQSSSFDHRSSPFYSFPPSRLQYRFQRLPFVAQRNRVNHHTTTTTARIARKISPPTTNRQMR